MKCLQDEHAQTPRILDEMTHSPAKEGAERDENASKLLYQGVATP